jgi:putative CocE/NonD family hydrolase
MKSFAALAFTLVLVCLSGAVQADSDSPPKSGFGNPARASTALYPERLTRSFYLPVRDGTKLAVSVTLPARDGKVVEDRFPVIWQHTSQNIDKPGLTRNGQVKPPAGNTEFVSDYFALSELTAHGYAVVTVVRRGIGASFGVRRGYHDRTEAYDAYDIVEWLAQQPWSNGAVGMVGCSNIGEAVVQAVSVAPPHLKAAFAGCFSWNKYDGFLRGSGIVANWGSGPQATFEQEMASSTPVEADSDRVQLRRAITEHAQDTPLFDLLTGSPYRDSFSPLTLTRFMYEGSNATYRDEIRRSGIPIYIQAGWFDDFRRENFIAYANLPPENRRLLIGPWTHCTHPDFALMAEMLRWFDWKLKGIDTGIAKEPPIHYFTVNAPPEKAWKATATWPVHADKKRFFLVGDGESRLASEPRNGASTRFTVDYKSECAVKPAAPYAARACHPTSGAVSFAAPPLAMDAEVTGHPVVSLAITSTTPQANLFVYLEDVAADGTVTVVSDGRQRASMRNLDTPPYDNLDLPWHRGYAEDDSPLRPGEPAEVVFDLLPVSWVFQKGHRIQVSVAGSDPRERARQESSPPPTIELLADAAGRSSITLPIVHIERD